MNASRPIQSALISVFHKDGLEPIVRKLAELGVTLYSTGGTETFIKSLGIDVVAVESITDYPSILGGRVKTLHPKIFGGILNRRSLENDQKTIKEYNIPSLDLVIVDLYPFEKTVADGASAEAIIEKIDIGGISLIRAAAKNYQDVLCVSTQEGYGDLLELLETKNGSTELSDRKRFATQAFATSSHYDAAIFNYFNQEEEIQALRLSESQARGLRYGENPHQRGVFYGDFDGLFEQLNGKELSYNNLLDVDAAVTLMSEFVEDEPTFAILKHNNACGLASRERLVDAYRAALAADPVSAFGGVLIANKKIDVATAQEIKTLFCEVVIAPEFDPEAVTILSEKKNRILLVQKHWNLPEIQVRTALNGQLVQQRDLKTDIAADLKTVTKATPSASEVEDLLFASKICKHTKSNTIVLAKNKQLLASGTGQTSRVDALYQAVHKAKQFEFDLEGSVMASDAFFPFPDCVEIADHAGVRAVIQPGGSIKDELSIEYCNKAGMVMVMTGTRHFKH
jgi:phosphoribosylaminoimidazolecarboxamide formyltransferase/IMP cyclohydrolase